VIELFASNGEWYVVPLVAVLWWVGVSTLFGMVLSNDRKTLLTYWLRGDFDVGGGGSWIHYFTNMFDSIFGIRYLSLRFFLGSAVASLTTVVFLYLILIYANVIDPDYGRIEGPISFFEMLLLGAILNIVPDYISLVETRWLLDRFKRCTSTRAHIALLIFDLIFTGSIKYVAILMFQFVKGSTAVSPIELMAGFEVLSVFFFATFATSVWLWALCS